MATVSGRFNNISLDAASAVTQYDFVKMTSTGAAACGDGELAIGVALAAAAANASLPVQIDGIAIVKASGAIAKGAVVASDANGEATSTLATGDYEVGIALEAATAAGDRISILLKPGNQKTA